MHYLPNMIFEQNETGPIGLAAVSRFLKKAVLAASNSFSSSKICDNHWRSRLWVEDFLLTDTCSLPGLAEVGPEGHLLREAVADLLSYLAEEHAGQWLNGEQLLEVEQNAFVLPIGCQSFDDLLGGGLREGTITELVGTTASGKTQLCLQAAASAALTTQSAVVYVDTSHSFSGQRVAHIIGGLVGTKEQLQERRSEVSRAMNSIVRMQAFDMTTLLTLLEVITRRLVAAQQGGEESTIFSSLRLLIVDSASAIVSPVLGAGESQGHALMICLSRALKRLAVDHRLAVLTTCHTVEGEGGHSKPALGESWKSIPHMRVLTERDFATGICTATLTKHTNKACGGSVRFRIQKTGIETATDNMVLDEA